jgi:peroxiredoxin Q/BCP
MSTELLSIGSPAPSNSVTNQKGEAVSIADYQGQKLIVFIYPKAGTGSCLKEALSIRDGYADLKALGYEIVGLSPDKERKLSNFIQKHEAPYDLLSDPEHELIEAFGAWGEKKMYGKTYMGVMRSTFVLDEQGTVTHVVDKVITKAHAEQLLEILGNPVSA